MICNKLIDFCICPALFVCLISGGRYHRHKLTFVMNLASNVSPCGFESASVAV